MDDYVAVCPAIHDDVDSWAGIDQLQVRGGGAILLWLVIKKNPEVTENLLVQEPGRVKSDKFYIEL